MTDGRAIRNDRIVLGARRTHGRREVKLIAEFGDGREVDKLVAVPLAVWIRVRTSRPRPRYDGTIDIGRVSIWEAGPRLLGHGVTSTTEKIKENKKRYGSARRLNCQQRCCQASEQNGLLLVGSTATGKMDLVNPMAGNQTVNHPPPPGIPDAFDGGLDRRSEVAFDRRAPSAMATAGSDQHGCPQLASGCPGLNSTV
ncbi:hypothetical protein CPLU01_07237 [Colletotrichum plurivorum]|uniref:Uncharacterized protein n=1 Tax=Colletotrichum plurivorum TaxID=2175906 RepID=A0A8H6KFQ6_9PEZI|nr:hypothetical protein CPLU01_07237 [Colletotrichum plurivorum]